MHKTELAVIAAAVVALAVHGDIVHGRISNMLTFPAIVAGLLVNAAYDTARFIDFFAAALIPAFIFYPLYKIQVIGGGDVKLFSVIGSFTGIRFGIAAIITSFAAGGAMSLLHMVRHRILVQRLKIFTEYIAACISTNRLLDYTEPYCERHKSRFSFSTAILAAILINIFILRV